MKCIRDDVIEILAQYEHDRWSRWQRYLFSKCRVNKDGSLTIPKEFVERWARQMNTEYNNLLESEKASDRIEAKRIIKCMEDGSIF